MFKKISIIIFSIILIVSLACFVGCGETPPTANVEDYVDFVVDVEEGRDIRVLQLTDIQTLSVDQKRYESRVPGNEKTDTFLGYERYVGQVITRYNPDLIIMTGDNVYGEFDDNGEHHLGLVRFMESFGIPWAPVFGNHDNESFMGVDWQCEQFVNAEHCLFKQRDLTGNGNYTVGLRQGGKLKRVFYMMDSNGSYGMSAVSLDNNHSKKSTGFGIDQIEWYTESILELKQEFKDVKLSMAFHIQLAVFADAFAQYGYNENTITSNPINLDENQEAIEAGDFGYIGASLGSAWDTDYTVYESIKELGIDSVFVGHEHKNSASVNYDGIRFTFGQKSSSYDAHNVGADGPILGGTYITVNKEDGTLGDCGLYLYDHELGYESDYVKAPEEEYGDGGYDTDRTYEEILGKKCYKYNFSEFSNTSVTLESNEEFFAKIDESSYIFSFKFKPISFNSYVSLYGYTKENKYGTGYMITLNNDKIMFGNNVLSYYFNNNVNYDIDVGFVSLYNGNTVRIFIRINGNIVAWQNMECYGKTAGNFKIVSSFISGSSYVIG